MAGDPGDGGSFCPQEDRRPLPPRPLEQSVPILANVEAAAYDFGVDVEGGGAFQHAEVHRTWPGAAVGEAVDNDQVARLDADLQVLRPVRAVCVRQADEEEGAGFGCRPALHGSEPAPIGRPAPVEAGVHRDEVDVIPAACRAGNQVPTIVSSVARPGMTPHPGAVTSQPGLGPSPYTEHEEPMPLARVRATQPGRTGTGSHCRGR